MEAGDVLPAMFLAGLLQSATLAYLIRRVRWSGWRLVGAVFLAVYGLRTVVNQIDSLVFLGERLPPGTVPALLAMGAISSALFSPLAVWVLGRMRRDPTGHTLAAHRAMTPQRWVVQGWAWKLAAIAVLYVVLYWSFGYLVAWQSPAVRAYYGANELTSLAAQTAEMWGMRPWFYPLQAVRGLLWTAFAWPLLRTHRGRRWEVSLAGGLLLAVWSADLLMPNPYMPAAVARVHLVEIATSNLAFGGLVGWLLSGRAAAERKPEQAGTRLQRMEVEL
jgi:hypothetical protein